MKSTHRLPWLIAAVAIGISGWFLLRAPSDGPGATTAIPRPPAPRSTTAADRDRDGVFADFSVWLKAFRSADSKVDVALVTRGVDLARARRPAMRALIDRDPEEALRRAVTLDEFERLPPEIRAEVEEPFSALAHVRVLPVCLLNSPDPPAARRADVVRLTEVEGHAALASHVFGRRLALDTKENSPVQGIRLGSAAALRDEVFHPLDAGEVAVATAKYPPAHPGTDRCFATGHPLGADAVTTLSGGRVFRFENRPVLTEFNRAVAALDARPGPHSGASVLFLPSPASRSGAFDLSAAVNQVDAQASAWTETKKRVFIIRADFADRPNATFPVVSDTAYASTLNTTVSDAIRAFSYGKTWIEATVSPQVTRAPRTAASYAADVGGGSSDNAALLGDAKAAFRALNGATSLDGYDIIGVWFVAIGMKGAGITYAGLAGGSDLWIQGNTGTETAVHEFGHNFGLGHSSFWVPPAASSNPVDPAGANDEYGDPFDTMGDGPLPHAHFHAEAKQRLNWLGAGDWTDATAAGSGTYRVHRIDHPDTTGVRGVRVTRGVDDHLWVSHRRSFSNAWLKGGASIVWQRPGAGRSWLIDLTPGSLPGSESDRTDGALAIGHTYADLGAPIFITPLARGGVTPNEYIDVQVNLGPFPGNQPPVAVIEGPSTISARQSVIFTAQASDPNHDSLAYAWDFGGGFTFDNNPSVTTAWSLGGTFTVKLTVSDLKGGSVSVAKTVTVTDPLMNWSDRANTSIGTFNALAASPTTILAVGEDFSTFKGPAALSADGATWSSGTLGQNQHGYGAVWDGTQFIIAGMDYDFGLSAFVGCILTSPTGTTWTRRLFTGKPLRSLAAGAGVRIAVGDDGHIRRSPDGITWNEIASGTTRSLRGVAYGGGRFVATGYGGTNGNGVVLTSPDGLSWTDTSSGAGVASWQDLRRIVWAHDRFLSSGWYSKLKHSVDLGVSFQTTQVHTVDAPALAAGQGVYFAAGQDRDAGNANVDLVSIDGANWTSFGSGAPQVRKAALFFQGTFITVGENHSIRQSGTIAPAAAGYVAWRDGIFPDHGHLSTAEADADFDGMGNLFEYGNGLNPLDALGVHGATAAPQVAHVPSNPALADRLALEFTLPEPAAADLVYSVDATSNPGGPWAVIATKIGAGDWGWIGGGPSRIFIVETSDARRHVTIGDSEPLGADGRRFLKLSVTINQ